MSTESQWLEDAFSYGSIVPFRWHVIFGGHILKKKQRKVNKPHMDQFFMRSKAFSWVFLYFKAKLGGSFQHVRVTSLFREDEANLRW